MKRENRGLLLSASAGIELSWLYAWATFLTVSIAHRPFPFLEAIGTFGLATALAFFSRGRGWRIIQILGLQLAGFTLATVRVLYVFNYWSWPFFNTNGGKELFHSPRGFLDWLSFLLILFSILLFWSRGVALARRPVTYRAICSRFDVGLSAFFLLVLTKFLLLVKGGIQINDPRSALSLFPLFVFSLLAIGLVRTRSDAQRDFLPGYQGIGVIVSFTAVLLLFGMGLVLFFLPHLTAAAEMGYGVLKTVTQPLGPVLAVIVRFLFLHGCNRRPEPHLAPLEGNESDIAPPVEGSWWTELLEKILGWGFLGLLGLLVLIVSAFAVVYLLRWLFSRTGTDKTAPVRLNPTALWLSRLFAFLLFLWGEIARRVRGHRNALELYTALLGWGRHSGLPHLLSETPTEYGLRLKNQFPGVKKEIQSIIEAFNEEVYGEVILDEDQMAIAQCAWRRLRRPLHWPSRLKTWFFRPGQPETIGSRGRS